MSTAKQLQQEKEIASDALSEEVRSYVNYFDQYEFLDTLKSVIKTSNEGKSKKKEDIEHLINYSCGFAKCVNLWDVKNVKSLTGMERLRRDLKEMDEMVLTSKFKNIQTLNEEEDKHEIDSSENEEQKPRRRTRASPEPQAEGGRQRQNGRGTNADPTNQKDQINKSTDLLTRGKKQPQNEANAGSKRGTREDKQEVRENTRKTETDKTNSRQRFVEERRRVSHDKLDIDLYNDDDNDSDSSVETEKPSRRKSASPDGRVSSARGDKNGQRGKQTSDEEQQGRRREKPNGAQEKNKSSARGEGTVNQRTRRRIRADDLDIGGADI
ncbi:Hypothetical predicted protein [Paramuricea clavata]|uniref:Uncharacterized protein n=1 Tax=Paramuricea clavata TaxID=317549 RepID=A0A7D9EVY7_PARCT|nr:Hypothetical predicted protein [Paramuricea clavata]